MTGSETESRHRILVVDDDESSRDIAGRCLRREHDIVTAANAASAVAVVESESVDLVLLDELMPDSRGTDICKRLKELQKDSYLPVILLTALNEQEDRNAGLAAGADDFLSKPFDQRELRLRVNTFLRLRDQGGRSESTSSGRRPCRGSRTISSRSSRTTCGTPSWACRVTWTS